MSNFYPSNCFHGLVLLHTTSHSHDDKLNGLHYKYSCYNYLAN